MRGTERVIGFGEVRQRDPCGSEARVDHWVPDDEGALAGDRRPTGFLTTLERTQRAAVIPYGYTLCVWSGSALIIDAGHHPGITGILGYTLGAVAGFVLLKRCTTGRAGEGGGGGDGGGVHLIPILAVIASVAVIGRSLSDPWVWAVCGAVVTATYFLTVAAQTWVISLSRRALLNRRMVRGQRGTGGQ